MLQFVRVEGESLEIEATSVYRDSASIESTRVTSEMLSIMGRAYISKVADGTTTSRLYSSRCLNN